MKRIISIIGAVIAFTSFGCNSSESVLTETDTIAPALNLKLKIIVEEDLGEGEGAYLPIKATTERLLRQSGFEIADSNSTDNNIKLVIKVKGIPRSGDYTGNIAGGTLYTGASLSGTFSFEDSAGKVLEASQFKRDVITPGRVLVNVQRKPSDAPFDEAFFTSDFFVSLATVLAHKFGKNAAFYYCRYILQEHSNLNNNSWIYDLVNVFGNLHDVRAIKPLLNYDPVNHSFEDVRANAIAKIGTSAVNPLISILNLNSEKRTTQIALAAWSLGELGNKRAVEPLRKCLNSKYPSIQFWSAYALSKLGDSLRKDLMFVCASDMLSKYADYILSQTGDYRTIDLILDHYDYQSYLYDDDWQYTTLKKITHMDLGNSFSDWKKWWAENKSKYIK